MPQKISRDHISYNFHFAKVAALFAVIVGHYAQAGHFTSSSFLWIPTQVGLYVFGFSSGYFTSLKYRGGFSISGFWKAKVPRLLAPLLVIDVFLIILLLIRGEANVFHWQSVPAWFGLTGVLRWFDITRVTPFGNGLWFFTLLLLFYGLFPLIERINRSRSHGLWFVVVSLFAAMVLQRLVPLGVTFWETAWFFILGAYCGRHLEVMSWKVSAAFIAVCSGMLPLARYGLQIPWMTPPLVMGLGLGMVWLVTSTSLPLMGGKVITVLSGVMLEMYVIHTYLFVFGWSGSWLLDLLLSLGIIAAASISLHPAGKWLGSRVVRALPN
jgi:hypothetical protein